MLESDAVHSETLWILQVRKGPKFPWTDYGTHTSDLAAALRIYDYGVEHPSDDFPEIHLARVEVSRHVEDPERLRKLVEQKAAEEKSSELQSN